MSKRGALESATRDRILQAAMVVFAERGYHRATVDDIVTASESSKGSFYHYFQNKQAIFLHLLDHLAELVEGGVEFAIGSEEGALAKVEAALRIVLEVAAERRDLARLLLIESAALGPEFEQSRLAIHRRFAALIQRHLDRAVADDALPAQDTAAAAAAWIGAINEVITQALASDRDLMIALPALRTLLLRSVGARAVG
jgi:AcrR family transcriptional regulator